MSTSPVSDPGAFKQVLSVLSTIMLTLSVVTPASSMFIIIPGVIAQAGTGVIPSLVVAGIVGAIVALVYAELASRYRSTGGEYVYVARVLNDIPAYPIIVVNLITQTFITSVLAIGAGDYFHQIMPIDPTTTAVIVVIIATLFGVLHIQANAWITSIFFAVEFAALATVVHLGLPHIHAANLGRMWLPFSFWDSGNSHLATTPLITIAMATAATLFAFNGYEEAVYLNEQMRRPKLIGWVIIICFLLSIFLESTPTVVALLSSADVPSFVNPKVNQYVDLVRRFGGDRWVVFISASISIAVLNACLANILLTARFLFSAVRSGGFGKKFTGPLKRLNSQNVPAGATLFVGSLGVAACYVPLNTLFVLTGTGLVFIYGALCWVLVRDRSKMKKDGRSPEDGTFYLPWPWVPVLPILGGLALAFVLIANWMDPDIGRKSILYSLGEILLGLAYWFIRSKAYNSEKLVVTS